MQVIKSVVEDPTLSPAEKVLFAILYCRKEGRKCNLSVQDLLEHLSLGLEELRGSLQHLEKGGFIKLDEGCQITDATSFLSCAVLTEDPKHKRPAVPRP